MPLTAMAVGARGRKHKKRNIQGQAQGRMIHNLSFDLSKPCVPCQLAWQEQEVGWLLGACQILSSAFGFAFAAAGGERKTESRKTKLLRLRVAANLVHLPGKPAGVQSGAVQPRTTDGNGFCAALVSPGKSLLLGC